VVPSDADDTSKMVMQRRELLAIAGPAINGKSLVQCDDGRVSLDAALPPDATEFRVYLSKVAGQRGDLWVTLRPDASRHESTTFEVPAGQMHYATVRSYDSRTGAESINNDQYPVHMLQAQDTPYDLGLVYHHFDRFLR